MSSDSYFGKGKMHSVCQDYALNGSLDDDGEYVILSDGCSSSKFTEIGAQILCHVAKQEIILYGHTGVLKECSLDTISSLIGNNVFKKADEIRRMYGIPRSALEATLFIMIKTNVRLIVLGWGDGVVIMDYLDKKGESKQLAIEINYSLNAPFYLISDLSIYLESCRKKGVLEPRVFHTYYVFSEDGIKKKEITLPFMAPFEFENTDTANEVSKDTLISVSICSDGVSSYIDEDKKGVKLDKVVPGLVRFKNTTGEFVKKRMFFFNKEMRAKDWDHYDDISYGTIHF